MNNNLLQSIQLGKPEISEVTQEIIKQLNDGNINPLETHLRFKAIENVIKTVKPILDPLARSEAEKYGERKFTAMGANVELAETGTKYDYSNCGDPVLTDLNLQLEALEAKIEKRKEFLKAIDGSEVITDQSTGEIVIIYPPVKTSTSSIKVSFK